jgi:hypothetical protein
MRHFACPIWLARHEFVHHHLRQELIMRMMNNRTFTVVLAALVLVGGANLAAYAANGSPLLLGKTNNESVPATVHNTGPGPALELQTRAAAPPLAVSSKKKVAKLNADRLDGKDSTAFAPYPKVIRGSYAMGTQAATSGSTVMADISFGWTLPSAPTTHYIEIGDPNPPACPGSATAPNAKPGHLCIFERTVFGAGFSNIGACDGTGGNCPGADKTGAILYGYTTSTGTAQVLGSWAVRPAGKVSAAKMRPSDTTKSRVGTGAGR